MLEKRLIGPALADAHWVARRPTRWGRLRARRSRWTPRQCRCALLLLLLLRLRLHLLGMLFFSFSFSFFISLSIPLTFSFCWSWSVSFSFPLIQSIFMCVYKTTTHNTHILSCTSSLPYALFFSFSLGPDPQKALYCPHLVVLGLRSGCHHPSLTHVTRHSNVANCTATKAHPGMYVYKSTPRYICMVLCRWRTPHVWLGSIRPRSQCVGGMLLVQWCYKHVLELPSETGTGIGLQRETIASP